MFRFKRFIKCISIIWKNEKIKGFVLINNLV